MIRSNGLEATQGTIRNLSLEGEPPPLGVVLYDKALVCTIVDGTKEEVEAAIKDRSIANAQGRNGETLLMKAARVITSQSGLNKTWLVETLLDRKADPMVCCQSKKNMLHDLFWTAKPPPGDVLAQMQDVCLTVQRHVGTSKFLELCTAPDMHKHQPLHFLREMQFETYRNIMDKILEEDRRLCLAVASSGISAPSEESEQGQMKPVPSSALLSCMATLER